MLAWLSVWSKVKTGIWLSWCYCHSLSLASVKSSLVLPCSPAHPGSPRQRAVKRVCVCVCVFCDQDGAVGRVTRVSVRQCVQSLAFELDGRRTLWPRYLACWFILTLSGLFTNVKVTDVPSVLWRCWLGGRKSIWPVKNWVVGCWRGYLSGARCRLAHGPADATATHCLLLQ